MPTRMAASASLDNLCSYSFAANGGVAGGPVALGAGCGSADLRHQQRHSADLGHRPDQQCGARRPQGGPRLDARTRTSTARCACARSRPAGTSSLARRLPARARRQAQRIDDGVEDVLATGKLRRVPAVFVTGRNDGILPPNFTLARLFRPQQRRRRLAQLAALLRGHQRASPRQLQPVPRLQ